MRRSVTALIMVMGAALIAGTASAQEGEELGVDGEPALEAEDEAAGDEEPAEVGEGGESDDDAEAFLAGDEEGPLIEAPEEEEGIGWDEPPEMRFWMVGARWRMIMVPDWLLDAFMDFPANGIQPPSVTINQAAGIEFTTRKNRFSITGAVWWAGYNSNVFIANEAGTTGDPEYIESSINLLMFTVDFVHSYMFNDWIGITYGAGLGLGVKLAGGLERNEAYRDEGEFARCERGTADSLCESDGYYNENDPNVWPVYPWINILLGIRFKVFRHLEINVDGGVGLGFLFGARVNYIF